MRKKPTVLVAGLTAALIGPAAASLVQAGFNAAWLDAGSGDIKP
jgi:hypothetical protein